MSAFLGPIHYWLYNKIQLQEKLTAHIAQMAVNNKWIAGDIYSKVDERPLDELIDESNIHGWLQTRISDAETRYAELVTRLLGDDSTNIETLKQAAFSFGKGYSIPQNAGADEALQSFTDSFVNGMPCDHVNNFIVTEADNAEWEESIDVHAGYWTAAGGDPDNYYILRGDVMRGMLDGSGLAFEETSPKHYRIYRK